MKILVADENERMRNAIRVELESGGYEVVEASDGIEALVAAAKECPDLVVLDTELPKLDGFQTCRKLRGPHYSRFLKQTTQGRHVPILFVTGRDVAAVRNESQQLDAAFVLSKPFAEGQVLSAVNSALQSEEDLEDATVLVVEDSAVARCILLETLKRTGVAVLEAIDGVQAFEILRSRCSEIDVVITDMFMPRMNGMELCEKIRKELHLSDLPVIFLTAASEQSQLMEIFHAGATDYLLKPFLKEELLARLNVQLEKLRMKKDLQKLRAQLEEMQRMQEECTVPAVHFPQSSLNGNPEAAGALMKKTALEQDMEEVPEPNHASKPGHSSNGSDDGISSSEAGETESPNNADIFDKEELMARVEGEKDLFDEILGLFLEDIPHQVKKLEEGLAARDNKIVAGQGHAIKGAAANIGANALKNAALAVEKAGSMNDWDVIDAAYQKMLREFDVLNDFLKASLKGKNP